MYYKTCYKNKSENYKSNHLVFILQKMVNWKNIFFKMLKPTNWKKNKSTYLNIVRKYLVKMKATQVYIRFKYFYIKFFIIFFEQKVYGNYINLTANVPPRNKS